MYQLLNAIPDLEVFLTLEPEELGTKILFLLREPEYAGLVSSDLLIERIIIAARSRQEWLPQNNFHLSRTREGEISQACAEAFGWLENQGLLIRADGMNGANRLRRLSRRALRFKDEKDFAQHVKARHLPKEILHPRIAQKVWMAFVRGEYDGAVFQAMKAVEVAVREASGLSDLIGVTLMRQAFRPENGLLTDATTEKGEQEARAALFVGAIGSFKNPQSHRDVNLDNAAEATEVILLANHLLRIVDSRSQVKT